MPIAESLSPTYTLHCDPETCAVSAESDDGMPLHFTSLDDAMAWGYDNGWEIPPFRIAGESEVAGTYCPACREARRAER